MNQNGPPYNQQGYLNGNPNLNHNSVLHSPIHPRDSQLYSKNSFYQTPNPNSFDLAQHNINPINNNSQVPLQPPMTSYANERGTGLTPPIGEKTYKRKKYCFCLSKNGCIIFSCCIFAFLAILAVAGFFLWPRIPQVKYKNVSLVSNSGQVPFSDSLSAKDFLQAAKVKASGLIVIPLVIELSVTNPNYITWKFNNVTIDGSITLQNSERFDVGNGTIYEPFSMPSKSVDNKLLIYYNFILNSRAVNFVQAADLVKTSCSVGGPPFRFNYKAKIFINAIKWLRIVPTINDAINFNCPTTELSSLGVDVSNLISLLTLGK
ncbi:hypothetical protein BB561_002132 [Smittium simulii]|uniref:Uncharacterized protein n=1 Tax=Smittium simulii TaxID=133385 RepID=A0A2T9YRP8_9FUNG|nr:hypothetical protein BB561_002132 [Smittium simulii]